MLRVIEVRTGARLHFGPLASGATSGRCFGGIGMLVTEPAIAFRAVEHESERYIGCSRETGERIARLRQAWSERGSSGAGQRASIPAISWEFTVPPVEHAGFGTGTQLSLAVASVLSRFEGVADLPITEIAQRTGRGRRSAIGLHGFERGGFLVDAGQAVQGALGQIAACVPVPEDWRIVILRPRDAGPGLSGAREVAAFEGLEPMSSALTDSLCRIALMEILPALLAADCDRFRQAVSMYGRSIGEYFAPVQGGVLADGRVRQLVRRNPALADLLIQSSWGPSVVAFFSDLAAAQDFQTQLGHDLDLREWSVEVAAPLNRGADIRSV